MSRPVEIIIPSRKSDKLLIVIGTVFFFLGLFAIVGIDLLLGLIMCAVAIGAIVLGRFLDWWHRGKVSDVM